MNGKGRLTIWFLVALGIGALIGFIPEFVTVNQQKIQLDEAQRTLHRTTMQLDLASAALNARRGEYERAREELSRFFTSFQKENANGDNASLGNPQQIQQILKQRDDLITLLARSDPASGDRLSNLELEFRKNSH